MNPTHSPSRVATTYHSGGIAALAIAFISVPFLPATAPASSPKMNAPIWPTRNPIRA